MIYRLRFGIISLSLGMFVFSVFVILGLSSCQAQTSARQWRWTQVETGLPRQAIVLAVAAHPSDPQRLWAGYYVPGGLAASMDGGQSWLTGAEGLGDNPIFDLLVIPENKNRVSEGDAADISIWAATRDGLFWSKDGGTTWQLGAGGLPPVTTFALAADANGRLYVGLDGSGIYRENQDKSGWTPLTTEGPLATAAVLSLAVSADGQQLYAGTAAHSVFASRDGGRTWQDSYPAAYVPNIVLNPADPVVAVASLRDQLVRTRDGGQSWQSLRTPWGSDQVVSLLWLADGTLSVGTAQGQLYQSRDGGDSWEGGQTDLPGGGIMDLALAQTQGGDQERLLAGTWTGIYGSDNGGRNWQKLAPALGQLDAETLLTTPEGLFLGTRNGLFQWQPETSSWVLISKELPSGAASLAVDPADPKHLYAGTISDGVYYSQDGGKSWQPLPSLKKGIPAIAIDPKENDNIYILAIWERVYESRDGGRTWGAHWAGLGEVVEMVSLAVDPAEPVVYAGAEMGLYRRPDDDDWELVAPELADQSILALLALPRQSLLGQETVLYIGTTRGIYYSLDKGETVQGGGSGWGQGLGEISVTALLAHPEDDQTLYAGTAFAGVYHSTDGGQNWQPIHPPELAGGIIESLAWGPEGELFVAATNGVWMGQ